jgi:hypothetical protein
LVKPEPNYLEHIRDRHNVAGSHKPCILYNAYGFGNSDVILEILKLTQRGKEILCKIIIL